MPAPTLKPPAKSPPRLPRRLIQRFLLALALSAGLIAVSLLLGILGYRFVARFTWIDSLLNATMILTGMGPIGALTSNAAKLFASAYALLAGFVYITATGIILAPIFHWVLHRFHLEQGDAH